MRNLHVRNVRLVQLEPEPTRGEHGGEGEVELAVCEAGMETYSVSKYDLFDVRRLGQGKEGGRRTYFMPRQDREPLPNGTSILRSCDLEGWSHRSGW